MANHRGPVKLCNIPKIYRCHERYLHTISHFLVLSGFLINIYRRFLQLKFCSTVQLGLSLWSRELDKPPRSWRRCRLFHSSETLLLERVERLNYFQNRCEKLQRHLPLTIFLYNPSVLSESSSLGEFFQLVVYNRFEHRVTR